MKDVDIGFYIKNNPFNWISTEDPWDCRLYIYRSMNTINIHHL